MLGSTMAVTKLLWIKLPEAEKITEFSLLYPPSEDRRELHMPIDENI